MFSNDWYILICHIDVTTGGVKCQSFPPDFTEHVRGQRLPRINKAYPLYWFMIKCLAAYSKGVVSQEKTRHILFGHRTSDSSETHVTPQSFKLYSSFVLILFWPFRMGKVPDGKHFNVFIHVILLLPDSLMWKSIQEEMNYIHTKLYFIFHLGMFVYQGDCIKRLRV